MVDAVAAAAAADGEDSRKTDNQLPDWEEEDLGDESSDGNPDVAHRYDLMEHRN